MWSDSETDIDFLNYSEVAELISELIADANLLPLSLGVFGGWGMGKSTTLKLVELELEKTPESFLVIKFDAWLYQGLDDARAALMSVISSSLIDAAPDSLKDKAVGLLGRVNKLRALGLLLEGGALALGVPTFGVLNKGVSAVATAFSDKPDTTNVNAVKEAAGDVASRFGGLLNPKEPKGPPEEIDAFRQEFGELLAGLGKTLVVFIDNLDRCLPDNAIHTLEAIRLFLFMPKTAFVVAADEDMIRHAVTQHFKNPAQRHVADYLDKLIQIPVRVPRVGIQEVRAYLFMLICSRAGVSSAELETIRSYLIQRLRKSWSTDGDFGVKSLMALVPDHQGTELLSQLEMADRIAPILALSPGVMGNPRTVKRMLNVVRMRMSVARRREMPLDEAMITKLALFERCTDIDATEQLHNLINAAAQGKPIIFNELESAKSGETPTGLPDAWTKHTPFLLEWAKLDPPLTGVDLRPAVYLARETVPLRISTASTPPAVLAAAEALVKIATVSSPAAKTLLDPLRPDEVVSVMELILAEMRKNPNWDRARSDFRGAVVTADRSDDAAALLARFVRSLQLPKSPGWMSTMIKGKSWWEQ